MCQYQIVLITVSLSYVLVFGMVPPHNSSDLFWLPLNIYFSSEILNTLVKKKSSFEFLSIV